MAGGRGGAEADCCLAGPEQSVSARSHCIKPDGICLRIRPDLLACEIRREERKMVHISGRADASYGTEIIWRTQGYRTLVVASYVGTKLFRLTADLASG